jgi:hypothetical protein
MAIDRQPEFQAILQNIMGDNKVYFQPDENIKMVYPCIVYQRDLMTTQFASNIPWRRTLRYQVTLIDRDPNSPYLEGIAELPLSAFNRHFVVDNLNQDNFIIYF